MTVTKNKQNVLRTCKRTTLWTLYGSFCENDIWRIRINRDQKKINKGREYSKIVKPQRLQWLFHLERRDDTVTPRRIMKANVCYLGRGKDRDYDLSLIHI